MVVYTYFLHMKDTPCYYGSFSDTYVMRIIWTGTCRETALDTDKFLRRPRMGIYLNLYSQHNWALGVCAVEICRSLHWNVAHSRIDFSRFGWLHTKYIQKYGLWGKCSYYNKKCVSTLYCSSLPILFWGSLGPYNYRKKYLWWPSTMTRNGSWRLELMFLCFKLSAVRWSWYQTLQLLICHFLTTTSPLMFQRIQFFNNALGYRTIKWTRNNTWSESFHWYCSAQFIQLSPKLSSSLWRPDTYSELKKSKISSITKNICGKNNK
jgi:hypothetical protein